MTKTSNLDKFVVFIKKNMMYPVVLVLVIFFSIQSSTFLSVNNILSVINQASYVIVIGVGIAMIMLAGALDLSVGYQVAVVTVVMGMMGQAGIATPIIIISGVALSVVLSLINGSIYAYLKVFPFIITLATQYIFYGVAFILSNSKSFRDFDDAYKFVGQKRIPIFSTGFSIPIAIIVMVVIVIIGSFILNKTYFGRNIYALGSNPDAVALSGVSVAKMRILVFALAGVFIGIGAYMTVSRVGTSNGTTGVGDEFTVMAGAMLGGIAMGGGGGKMSNMVIGVLTLQIITNGMNQMGVNTFWQQVAKGVILLIAITLSTLQGRAVVKNAKKVVGAPPTEEPVKVEAKKDSK